MKKLTNRELANLYSRLFLVYSKHESIFEKKFEDIYNALEREIDRRNFSLLYKAACSLVRNRGINQFWIAKNYANAVINSSEYFSSDEHHEIGSFYAKDKRPHIVDLVLSYKD